MIPENVIEIRDLSKRYPNSETLSLNAVSMDVRKGEKLGVFGPNGAGKTTLISLLCNILKPSSGSVTYRVDQHDLPVAGALKYVGYVPQDMAFYPELTAVQNLKYFGGICNIPSVHLKSRIDYLLTALGLDDVGKRKISTYSGGMKRRINLAIGLINDPQILFLDEPTAGVDVQSKMAIISLLNEMNDKGTTVIYTSHHLKEAEDFCDRIALIDHGRIIQHGRLELLLSENGVSDLHELLVKLTGLKNRN